MCQITCVLFGLISWAISYIKEKRNMKTIRHASGCRPPRLRKRFGWHSKCCLYFLLYRNLRKKSKVYVDQLITPSHNELWWKRHNMATSPLKSTGFQCRTGLWANSCNDRSQLIKNSISLTKNWIIGDRGALESKDFQVRVAAPVVSMLKKHFSYSSYCYWGEGKLHCRKDYKFPFREAVC